MGLLSRLSEEQERLKSEILSAQNRDDDPTYREALIAIAIAFPIDEIVNIAIVHAEMTHREEASIDDLVWAGEFLDHLDTVNWTVRPKNKRERGQVQRVPAESMP